MWQTTTRTSLFRLSVLGSSSGEEDLENLLAIQDIIPSDRYLQPRDSAGRHGLGILEAYTRDYPDHTPTQTPTISCCVEKGIVI